MGEDSLQGYFPVHLYPFATRLHHMALIYLDRGKAVICLPAGRGRRRPPCPAVPGSSSKPLPAACRARAPAETHARGMQVCQGFGGTSLRRTCSTSPSPPVNSSSGSGGGGEVPRAEWAEGGCQRAPAASPAPPPGHSPALATRRGRAPAAFSLLWASWAGLSAPPSGSAAAQEAQESPAQEAEALGYPVPEGSCVPRLTPGLDFLSQTSYTPGLVPGACPTKLSSSVGTF